MVLKNTKQYIEEKKSQGLYGWESDFAVHPGPTLKDEINFLGLTQKEVAFKTGRTVQNISRIVNRKEPITPVMALKLERIFAGRPSAQFWLNMQTAYDKKIAQIKEEKNAEKEIGFFKDHLKETFKELQRVGVFEKFNLNKKSCFKKAVLLIKDFFGTSTIRNISHESAMGVAFRKYNREDLNRYNLASLLKIGEKQARKVLKDDSLKEYNEKNFSIEVPKIKSLIKQKPSIFLESLQEICLNLGVIVIYVPNIEHTYFGGATKWIGGHPVIMLKMEKQWGDIFWFNFFHEVGHVLKHSKKGFFINFEKETNRGIEKEADEFAKEMLISDFYVTEETDITEIGLKRVAKQASVSIGIVAGRVCNDMDDRKLWESLSQFRYTIEEKAHDFIVEGIIK